MTTLGNVSLFAACQAGLVNNLNDGRYGAWLLGAVLQGLGTAMVYSSATTLRGPPLSLEEWMRLPVRGSAPDLVVAPMRLA